MMFVVAYLETLSAFSDTFIMADYQYSLSILCSYCYKYDAVLHL